jgi:DNA-binding CsgD family transcriptional regulator
VAPVAGVPLVARQPEQTVLCDLVGRTRSGEAGIVVIEGSAGLGKSALARFAGEQAREQGLPVKVARADQARRGTPLGVVETAVLPLPAVVDGPGGVDDVTGTAVSASPPATAAPLAETVVQDLVARAGEPEILVVEDIHVADEASLLVLTRLAELAGEHSVSLVVTVRTPTADAPCLRAVDVLLSTPAARRLVLRPLDAAGRGELCEALLGAPPGRRLERLLERTGGNPLFITQLARSLEEDRRLEHHRATVEVTSDDMPADLSATVVRRVDQLSESARVAVRLGAVIGADIEPARLARLAGQSVAGLAVPLREAVEAGVLVDEGDRLGFSHQLIHQAVYEDLPGAVRAELHRELAASLRAEGAPAVRVAYHEARGLVPGDVDEAASVQAVAAAVAVDDPWTALDLLDRIRPVLSSDADREGVDALRVGPLAWTGRIDEAVRTTERLVVATDLDDDEQARLRILLASLWVVQNRPDEAVHVLESAVDRVPPRWRTRVLAELALARLHIGDLDGSAGAAEEALALTEDGQDPATAAVSGSVLSRLQATRHRYRDGARSARAAARRADEAGTADAHRFVPWFFVGLAHLDLDEHDEASEALRLGRARGERHLTGWTDPLYDGLACSLAFRTGRLDDAEAAAEAAVSAARVTGSIQAVVWALAIHALVALTRDDPARAELLVADGEAHVAAGRVLLGIDYLFLARARLSEAAGDAPGALDHLVLAWRLFADLGHRNCHPLVAPDLVRLAQSEGDEATISMVLDELDRAADEGDLPLMSALVPWCRGLAEQDPALLATAEEALAGLDRPVDVVDVRTDRAVSLARRGRTAEARRLRDEILGEVDRLVAPGLRRRLLVALTPFGLGRPRAGGRGGAVSGWESLTPTERAVVDLVAQGLSNRDIAAERGCSARTVETHLGRSYRKLGVQNRTQLAVAAAGRADAPTDGER